MPVKSISELKQMVGETYVEVERFPVEAGKIAEFAEAVTDDDPVYTDATGETARERGFDNVPAPPTFTIASSFFRRRQESSERPDFGLHQERTLHGEQGFEFERVPTAGEVLYGEGEITDVYQREGSRGGTMTFVETTTTFYDADEEPVVRSTAVTVETGAPATSEVDDNA